MNDESTDAIERRFRGVYRQIPWANLNIDRTYQREQSDYKIKDIAEAFDPDAFGWLVVGRRVDGTLWVIDGGHRYYALQLMGYTDQNVPCMMLNETTPEAEARLYDIYNAKRAPMRVTERFKARLRYNDEEALAINKVLADAGYTVWFKRGKAPKNTVGAVDKIIDVYRTGAPGDLALVIEIVREAWGDDPNAVVGIMIGGVHNFIVKHRGQFEVGELARKLKTTTPGAILARAAQIVEADGGAKHIAVCRAIRKTYNANRRKGQLPEWTE